MRRALVFLGAIIGPIFFVLILPVLSTMVTIDEMQKKNKTLIIIELIVIGLLAGLIAYMIITARNQKIPLFQGRQIQIGLV